MYLLQMEHDFSGDYYAHLNLQPRFNPQANAYSNILKNAKTDRTTL